MCDDVALEDDVERLHRLALPRDHSARLVALERAVRDQPLQLLARHLARCARCAMRRRSRSPIGSDRSCPTPSAGTGGSCSPSPIPRRQRPRRACPSRGARRRRRRFPARSSRTGTDRASAVQPAGRWPSVITSRPVSTNPCASRITRSPHSAVRGAVPMKMNMAAAGSSRRSPRHPIAPPSPPRAGHRRARRPRRCSPALRRSASRECGPRGSVDIPAGRSGPRTRMVTLRAAAGEEHRPLSRRVGAADDDHVPAAIGRGLGERGAVVHARARAAARSPRPRERRTSIPGAIRTA